MKVGVRIAVATVLLTMCGAVSAAAAGDRQEKRPILLDEGALPNYRWGMIAERGSGRLGGKQPCISVIIYFRSSWGWSESDDRVCGPLPRGGPPEILSYTFDGEGDEVTIFAVAFEPRVETARFDLGNAGRRTTRLHIINSRQKRIAGVRPFRFQTFAIRGSFCLEEVQGFNSAGEVIYQSSADEECAS